jgi:ferredoxin-type protein NapH
MTQVGLMLLYIGGNYWGWNFIQGNLSSSLLFGMIPLSDPYATLQMFAAGAVMTSNLIMGALIITVFYMLVGGRVFCSWVCPVNIITDAANYLREKVGFNEIQKKQPASRSLRYWIIGLSLILSYILGVTLYMFVKPLNPSILDANLLLLAFLHINNTTLFLLLLSSFNKSVTKFSFKTFWSYLIK